MLRCSLVLSLCCVAVHYRLPAALSAEIDARPLRAERNLSELVLNAPEIVNPLVGYHGKFGTLFRGGSVNGEGQLSRVYEFPPPLGPPSPHPTYTACGSIPMLPAVLPRLWPSSSLLPGTAIDTVGGAGLQLGCSFHGMGDWAP